MNPPIPPLVPLTELARRIADQQAELDALRREYENAQSQLASLILRRQALERELKRTNVEIETLIGGATSALLPPLQAELDACPPRSQPTVVERPAPVVTPIVEPPSAPPPVSLNHAQAEDDTPLPAPPPVGLNHAQAEHDTPPPIANSSHSHSANDQSQYDTPTMVQPPPVPPKPTPPPPPAPASFDPATARSIGAGWHVTDSLDYHLTVEEPTEEKADAGR